MRNHINELRDGIRSISDEIVERATKEHIVYKSTLNFYQIYVQKKQFWVDVKLPRDEILSRFPDLDVRLHKDEFFAHIRCNEKTNISYLVKLAEQAFEKTL